MINGAMSEAQEGFAVLKDVDFETFNRFIQWAYVGYYSAADYHTTMDLKSVAETGDDMPDDRTLLGKILFAAPKPDTVLTDDRPRLEDEISLSTPTYGRSKVERKERDVVSSRPHLEKI